MANADPAGCSPTPTATPEAKSEEAEEDPPTTTPPESVEATSPTRNTIIRFPTEEPEKTSQPTPAQEPLGLEKQLDQGWELMRQYVARGGTGPETKRGKLVAMAVWLAGRELEVPMTMGDACKLLLTWEKEAAKKKKANGPNVSPTERDEWGKRLGRMFQILKGEKCEETLVKLFTVLLDYWQKTSLDLEEEEDEQEPERGAEATGPVVTEEIDNAADLDTKPQ